MNTTEGRESAKRMNKYMSDIAKIWQSKFGTFYNKREQNEIQGKKNGCGQQYRINGAALGGFFDHETASPTA